MKTLTKNTTTLLLYLKMCNKDIATEIKPCHYFPIYQGLISPAPKEVLKLLGEN